MRALTLIVVEISVCEQVQVEMRKARLRALTQCIDLPHYSCHVLCRNGESPIKGIKQIPLLCA